MQIGYASSWCYFESCLEICFDIRTHVDETTEGNSPGMWFPLWIRRGRGTSFEPRTGTENTQRTRLYSLDGYGGEWEGLTDWLTLSLCLRYSRTLHTILSTVYYLRHQSDRKYAQIEKSVEKDERKLYKSGGMDPILLTSNFCNLHIIRFGRGINQS